MKQVLLTFNDAAETFTFDPGVANTTISGRATSLAPKGITGKRTDRKIRNLVSRIDRWMALEGNREREFRNLSPAGYDGTNLSTADRIEIAHLLADPEWLSIWGSRISRQHRAYTNT